MTTRLEDVLEAVCSRVESLPSHNFQKIFLLGNEQEAKIACDILVTHGFGAKLYPENGHSRLYVAQLDAKMDATQALDSALAYANMLKTVQGSLEALHKTHPQSPDYRISMNSLSAGDKAISIHLTTSAKISISEQPLTRSVAQAEAVAQAAPKAKPAQKPKDPYANFMAGPAITQESWFARHTKRTNRPDGLFRRLQLYVFGNAASAGYIIALVFLLLLITYSIFVLSKGYICPDFVKSEQEKNHAWYCK